MRLLYAEFFKLWQRKSFYLFLLALCVINVSLFAYQQHLQDIPLSSYKKLSAQLSTLSNEKRYDYIKEQNDKIEAYVVLDRLDALRANPIGNEALINSILAQHPDIEQTYGERYRRHKESYYTDSLAMEEQFFQELMKEMTTLHDYPTFLEEINKKADNLRSVRIFHQDEGFSSRNIEATRSDYQKHKTTKIIFESEKGIRDALGFPITNFLIVIAILMMTSISILEEKEKNLFALLRTSQKGQWQTLSAKLCVLIVSSALFIFVLMFSNLLYMHMECGLGTLQRSIQSLASYTQCTLSITVGQYLILSFFVKLGAAILLILLVVWVALLSHHKVSYFLILGLLFAIEYLIFLWIPPTSSLRILKYLNIMTILQGDVLFQTYLNLNILGYPISLHKILLLASLIFALFITIGVYTTYHKQRHLQLSNINIHTLRHLPIMRSLWAQELYKLLYLQKGFLIVLFCILIQGYQFTNSTLHPTQEERIYMAYMEHLEGPLTEEKTHFIKQEYERFASLQRQADAIQQQLHQHKITSQQAQAMLQPIEGQLISKAVFDQIYTKYQTIQQHPSQQFVTPYGYERLLAASPSTTFTALLYLIFVLLTLASLYSFEFRNNMHRMLFTTIKGRRTLARMKQVITCILLLIFLLLFYVPDIARLHSTYGLTSLNASLSSLMSYEQVGDTLSIGAALCITYGLRLLAAYCFITILHAVSLRLRNHTITIFLGFTLGILPLLLAYGDIHILDSISLYPLFQVGEYLTSLPRIQNLLLITLFYSGCALLAHYKIKQRTN